ncbi:thermonuclease family protein [Sinirhodobacter populi]|uniref:Thermonuclease family protein n=1 Tax=Paenirhodobacter populi TaxID=2306993 RepID=A0A443K0J5_9RHOB|nr:thermonuclease family protein [Sinirhodobacter populi]RWR26211.1 thermonuclease family protein [Sinirhodobacter populi]
MHRLPRRRAGIPVGLNVLTLAAIFGILIHFDPAAPTAGTSGAETHSAIIGRASVIDGDTLDIHGQRIRLHGIDAPESNQPCRRTGEGRWRCGRDAAFALADRTGTAPVRCMRRDIGRYGRVVAICTKAGEDLGAWMVASGWAVAYRQYSQDYVILEQEARAAGRGLWQGSFDMPRDWRRKSRSSSAGAGQ